MFIPFMVGRFSSHLSLPQSTLSPQSTLRSLSFNRSGLSEATWTIMCGTSNHTNTNGINNVLLEEQRDSQFPLQIILTRMDRGISLGGIIPLLRALPVTHLNAITLYGDIEAPHDDQNPWTEVFWDVPELRIVEVGHGCAMMFIHALPPCAGVIFASTLTDIKFKEIVFRRHKCRGADTHEYVAGCLPCLHYALASRAEAGIVLQRLFFDNCPGILKPDITEFSKVVYQVEWVTEGL